LFLEYLSSTGHVPAPQIGATRYDDSGWLTTGVGIHDLDALGCWLHDLSGELIDLHWDKRGIVSDIPR
jgi:hypothetical protein